MARVPTAPYGRPMTTPTAPPAAPLLLILRMLTIAFMISVALFAAVVVLVVLGGREPFSVALALVVIVVGVVSALLVQVVGFRVRAIPPGTPDDQAARQAAAAVQSSTIQRLVISEVATIVALMGTFALGTPVTNFLIGAVISLALMVLFCWPTRANVARVEQSLDAKGYQSGLSAALFGDNAGPHRVS